MSNVRAFIAGGFLIASLVCVSCGTTKPAVESNQVFPGDLASVNRELSPSESRRVLDTIASTRTQKNIDSTRGFQTSDKGRWSDVYQAAVIGARRVEMAVVTHETLPDGIRFSILALNNDQGEMVVKGDKTQGVTSATASLGLFGERSKDAQALVHSFYLQLHALGAVPRPSDGQPEAATRAR